MQSMISRPIVLSLCVVACLVGDRPLDTLDRRDLDGEVFPLGASILARRGGSRSLALRRRAPEHPQPRAGAALERARHDARPRVEPRLQVDVPQGRILLVGLAYRQTPLDLGTPGPSHNWLAQSNLNKDWERPADARGRPAEDDAWPILRIIFWRQIPFC